MNQLIRLHAPSAYVVSRELGTAAATAPARAKRVMRHHGRLLHARLLKHSRGRPGPRVVTGVYLASFHVDYVGSNQYQARLRAYNTQPYSDRLEFGFHGTDSADRTYDQDPLPHFGPALAETFPGLTQDLAQMAAELPGDAGFYGQADV